MDLDYSIDIISGYPDNGEHQGVWTRMPFEIRKGEDGYVWKDKKGVQHEYNMGKKTDKRWIIHLSKHSDISESLNDIFEIKVNKDLDKILEYAVKIYLKSLKMEVKRIQEEIKHYEAIKK